MPTVLKEKPAGGVPASRLCFFTKKWSCGSWERRQKTKKPKNPKTKTQTKSQKQKNKKNKNKNKKSRFLTGSAKTSSLSDPFQACTGSAFCL
ncbi:MAG: hypothetical protein LBT59_08485 [Clostridiales bacterium]|jgi:hypothetical protein|nr:hypothetical protein [Clostridiales bacterium]